MKRLSLILVAGLLVFQVGCKKDPDPVTPAGPGESSTDLLVAKFTAAPTMDGQIDAMWGNAQTLVSNVEVPTLPARGTNFNSDGAGVEEGLGIFYPYSGEKYNFKMRSGYFNDRIYFLIEWDDAQDSKDRVSWYFDDASKTWKEEHKYANAADDKFYEDKFAFQFPIGEVAGFSSATCYATCHTASTLAKPGDKLVRHYTNGVNEKIDMWHWKRVRGAYADQIDDQKITYEDPAKGSSANGRHGDSNGGAGYKNNAVTLNNGTVDVKVPHYIQPGSTDYYWINKDDIGTKALEVIAVDGNGVLTLSDNSTIDPNGDAGYAHATGNKRAPSVVVSEFTGARADIDFKANYTGTGWVVELTRKLNTGDVDDVVFDPAGADIPFGFAIFNAAAIAHGIKPGLVLKFK
tara:strand:- start:12773 stop:13984 length:1212 start_codon:yes stop_codon:yes gene_type:complete